MFYSYESGRLHQILPSIRAPFDLEPLVRSIREGNAVVYVGAGASVPSGLPTWNQFLYECLLRAKKVSSGEGRWTQTDRLLKEGDYLTGADLLQKEIGQALEHYVWDIFGGANTPSPIHFAIARIPFSLAISTNYDRLLESAYKSRPNVWTWRDPAALFSAIKHRRFSVVKVHGDVGNGPSLVLTKTQYRDLMHLNRAFNDCLTTLLSLRTFLFVGSSLRDHDLLRLMDDAKLTYGNDFGPHYALLFEDEVDSSFSRLLHDTYNINVIYCSKPEISREAWRTEAVCSFLKVLSGKVANDFNAIESPARESPLFNLRAFSQNLLENILKRTGADRGCIAFVKDIELRGLYRIAETESCNPADIADPFTRIIKLKRFDEHERLIQPTSMLGSLFLKEGTSEPHLYKEDVCGSECSNEDHPERGDRPHSEVRSILACQIQADGQKVGVISIESFCRDAFTNDHLSSLKVAAQAAGAGYTEYRHRSESGTGIKPYLQNMDKFNSLMSISRVLRPLNLSYILYDIDYASGTVVARSIDPLGGQLLEEFGYAFEERSLVTTVLRSRQPKFIEDAAIELQKQDPELSAKGVEKFGIRGSVIAMPVRVGGHTSTVLVCWSRDANRDLQRYEHRVACLTRLIANIPPAEHHKKITEQSAYLFLDNFNVLLAKVDRDNPWTEKIENARFREQIIRQAMKALLDDSCGLARVRVWQKRTNHRKQRFEIVNSLTVRRATSKGKRLLDAYAGVSCDEGDPFCHYTIQRAETGEASAIWQHWSMFGLKDENCKVLDKDPNGSWIVCPIIRNSKLYGFLSADTHYPNKSGDPVEERAQEDVRRFQCCAVELVADILTVILRKNRVHYGKP